MELERHPPERGELPAVVAGGCCTTCCCCCCCCAYVVGGLVGAAVGTFAVGRQNEEVNGAVGRYWTLVGWTLLVTVVLGFAGFMFAGFWLLALGLLLFGLPAAQLLGSLLMLGKRDPAARRAALILTAAWVVFSLLGVWITVGLFHMGTK